MKLKSNLALATTLPKSKTILGFLLILFTKFSMLSFNMFTRFSIVWWFIPKFTTFPLIFNIFYTIKYYLIDKDVRQISKKEGFCFVLSLLIRTFEPRSGKSGQSYWIKKSICYYFALSQNAQETVWNKKRSEVIEIAGCQAIASPIQSMYSNVFAPIGVIHSYWTGWGSYSWACPSLTHKDGIMPFLCVGDW